MTSPYRTYKDGSIDYGHYHARAAHLRSESAYAFIAAIRALFARPKAPARSEVSVPLRKAMRPNAKGVRTTGRVPSVQDPEAAASATERR